MLRSVYLRSPEAIAAALTQLLERENIDAHEIATEVAIAALEMTRSSRRVSVPDALLWALARASGHSVRSFDRRFPRIGITIEEP